MNAYTISDLICRGRIHCSLCRAKDANGTRFREGVLKHLADHAFCSDFECPYGMPWTEKAIPPPVPPVARPPDVGNATADVLESAALSKERYEICKKCDKSSEEGHKCALYKGCCFGRWRTVPGNKCPAGKW